MNFVKKNLKAAIYIYSYHRIQKTYTFTNPWRKRSAINQTALNAVKYQRAADYFMNIEIKIQVLTQNLQLISVVNRYCESGMNLISLSEHHLKNRHSVIFNCVLPNFSCVSNFDHKPYSRKKAYALTITPRPKKILHRRKDITNSLVCP